MNVVETSVWFGRTPDRFGRRTALLISVGVCVAAGSVTVVATSLAVMVAARLVQGLAGSAGLVLGRATISDIAK